MKLLYLLVIIFLIGCKYEKDPDILIEPVEKAVEEDTKEVPEQVSKKKPIDCTKLKHKLEIKLCEAKK